jgi:hypothetical protein
MENQPRFNGMQKTVLVLFTALALIGLLWIIRLLAIDGFLQIGIPQVSANDTSLTLSLDNGDIVRGSKGIIASGSKPETKLSLLIDDAKVTAKPVMQQKAMLTFEADGMKSGDGYKNSIWVNDKLAYTFDKNIAGFTKLTVPINAELLQQQGNNKITLRAGSKKTPDDKEGEHDVWKFRALKFELGDGTVLDDPNYKTATVSRCGAGSRHVPKRI